MLQHQSAPAADRAPQPSPVSASPTASNAGRLEDLGVRAAPDTAVLEGPTAGVVLDALPSELALRLAVRHLRNPEVRAWLAMTAVDTLAGLSDAATTALLDLALPVGAGVEAAVSTELAFALGVGEAARATAVREADGVVLEVEAEASAIYGVGPGLRVEGAQETVAGGGAEVEGRGAMLAAAEWFVPTGSVVRGTRAALAAAVARGDAPGAAFAALDRCVDYAQAASPRATTAMARVQAGGAADAAAHAGVAHAGVGARGGVSVAGTLETRGDRRRVSLGGAGGLGLLAQAEAGVPLFAELLAAGGLSAFELGYDVRVSWTVGVMGAEDVSWEAVTNARLQRTGGEETTTDAVQFRSAAALMRWMFSRDTKREAGLPEVALVTGRTRTTRAPDVSDAAPEPFRTLIPLLPAGGIAVGAQTATVDVEVRVDADAARAALGDETARVSGSPLPEEAMLQVERELARAQIDGVAPKVPCPDAGLAAVEAEAEAESRVTLAGGIGVDAAALGHAGAAARARTSFFVRSPVDLSEPGAFARLPG